MTRRDLISVGRLESVIDEGFVSFRRNESFQPALFDLCRDAFLVFDSDIVFYVTIDQIRTKSKWMFLHFAEDGVIEAVRNARKTELCIPETDYQKFFLIEDGELDPVDMVAIFEDEVIGVISDYLDNPMQRVLVISTPDGKDILIPEVDAYVERFDMQTNRVYFRAIHELIDL